MPDGKADRAVAARAISTWALVAAAGLAVLAPASAAAQLTQAQATNFTDVAFGGVSFTTDTTMAQSLCVYASGASHAYNVRAVGSGSGSAFSLSNGAVAMPYEVQWSGTAGQTTGTALTANTAKSGFTSAASSPTCNIGNATSASLILILRATAVQAARAGSYSGTLSITITPE